MHEQIKVLLSQQGGHPRSSFFHHFHKVWFLAGCTKEASIIIYLGFLFIDFILLLFCPYFGIYKYIPQLFQ